MTIAVGIRRQADLYRNVVSVATLLRSLAANPALLTRGWFVEGYVAHGMGLVDRTIWEKQAHKEFDQFAPGGAASISPEIIRQDQKTLQAVSERVRRFVNERLPIVPGMPSTEPSPSQRCTARWMNLAACSSAIRSC